jgi:tetratricopeptide (TPR) repeat protein
VKAQPACETCWFELALITQPPAEAERLFGKVIELNPRHAGAHFHVGKLLAARGEESAAIEALKRAIALDPELDGAYYQLGVLYRKKGEGEKAKEILAALRARKEGRRAAAERSLEGGRKP